MLDFHNHLIPAVDDGAASVQETLTAVERMSAQGITHIITTPHFVASALKRAEVFESEMGRIDKAWSAISSIVADAFPKVRFERGVELALDEPEMPPLDPRVRLAGSRFALVEFPLLTIPPNSARPLYLLASAGVTPIVAHPERYENLAEDMRLLNDWKAHGAFLQVNAGSLLGAYGKRAAALAWRSLEAGLIDYLGSDHHARGLPLVAPALERLSQRGGDDQVKVLVSNGERLPLGLAPLRVPRLPKPRRSWKTWLWP